MDDRQPTTAAIGLGPRLLHVVRAQASALESGDFDRFTQLSDERDALIATLSRASLTRLELADREPLAEVVKLDRQTMAMAVRLLNQTERERQQLRHGRAALKGYGRPGARVASRPTVLDRAS